jgi:hypothetical protein
MSPSRRHPVNKYTKGKKKKEIVKMKRGIIIRKKIKEKE